MSCMLAGVFGVRRMRIELQTLGRHAKYKGTVSVEATNTPLPWRCRNAGERYEIRREVPKV